MADFTIENILQTRIGLKYDEYSKWTSSPGKDLVLKRGEVGFCAIPAGNAEATTAPTILFKVGDGTTAFSGLKWVSGLAADVHAWAKKATPDWTDFPALPITVVDPDATTKKFITKVEYANNTLTITRNDVEWTDVKNAPDFALKEELPTELGVMSVAGKEAVVATGDKEVEISLKIAEQQGEGVTVTQSANGLKVEVAHPERVAEAGKADHADAATKVDNKFTVKVGGEDVQFDGSAAATADVDAAIAAAIDAIPEVVHPEYSITKDATSEYAATYHLTKDGVNVGAAINIPKDLVVESGKVETLEAGSPWGEAGTYIVLTLANATNDKIYVPVDKLIEYVTSGSTEDSQVIISISEDHKVTATIGAGKIGTTELADGSVTEIKLNTEVQTKLNKQWATTEQGTKADSALQKINAGNGITVTEKANNEQTVSHGAIEGAEAKEHGDYNEDNNNVILGFKTDEFGHVVGTKQGEISHNWYTNGDDAWLMLHVGNSSPSTIEIKGAKVEDDALVIPAAPVGTGEAAIASVADGVVTIKGGAKLDDHILGNSDAADVVLAKVATTGKHEDIVDFEAGVKDVMKTVLYIDCGTATEVI